MTLKPWYKVITPREDLREGKPLDAAEFAVHLDQIRDGRATTVYQDPKQFFERTYLTKNLIDLSTQVLKRLSGEKTETSAVFNMTTQFGGGKTHALTLLYHLATNKDPKNFIGVSDILHKAGTSVIPDTAVAVFVGTEFDVLTGRGGENGEPIRKTPWGEIAYQLNGKKSLEILSQHEQEMTAPAGDVIRKFLPDKPCLILMDEIMNFMSRSRRSGMSSQFYSFLQNLSEEARGRSNLVLVISVPASELEMTEEDQQDYGRVKKLLDRLGKAIVMSEKHEVSEIIRRRLFEWDLNTVGQSGKVILNKDAEETCKAYSNWIIDHRQQLSGEFPIDHAHEEFKSTYPFHPSVISVFERKWQTLPRFQQTRGILRLLALWLSQAYLQGFKGAYKDSLITMGSAPLDDINFRAAVFEQLGESRLEAAVTTDITGKSDSHAIKLDKEAQDAIKKSNLHKKVATTIFFESNGGQMKTEATIPEIRLAVGDPMEDIGNIDTVLDELTSTCFYLGVIQNRYKFGITPQLNKLLSDRRATIIQGQIEQKVKEEIRSVFSDFPGITTHFFPEKISNILDRPNISLVIMDPEFSISNEKDTRNRIEQMTKEYGNGARTYKNALVWCIAESQQVLHDDARKLLAWEAIQEEIDSLRLEEGQKIQLEENIKKSERDLKECIWRTYKYLFLLGEDNQIKKKDLGMPHSSAANTISTFIINNLRLDGEIEDGVSPSFLIRKWPPAFIEWSTKNLRDAFFASPLFPRLINPDSIKDTIVRGVGGGDLGYVVKGDNGKYSLFKYKMSLLESEIDISDEAYIIKKDIAEEFLKTRTVPSPEPNQDFGTGSILTPETSEIPETPPKGGKYKIKAIKWSGQINPQRWSSFFMKILSKLVQGNNLKLNVEFEYKPEEGVSEQKTEEIKSALKELGSDEELEVE